MQHKSQMEWNAVYCHQFNEDCPSIRDTVVQTEFSTSPFFLVTFLLLVGLHKYKISVHILKQHLNMGF